MFTSFSVWFNENEKGYLSRTCVHSYRIYIVSDALTGSLQVLCCSLPCRGTPLHHWRTFMYIRSCSCGEIHPPLTLPGDRQLAGKWEKLSSSWGTKTLQNATWSYSRQRPRFLQDFRFKRRQHHTPPRFRQLDYGWNFYFLHFGQQATHDLNTLSGQKNAVLLTVGPATAGGSRVEITYCLW